MDAAGEVSRGRGISSLAFFDRSESCAQPAPLVAAASSISLHEWSETREMEDGRSEMGAAALEQAERAEAVRAAIAALPVELREAVVLSEYEQLSHAEIASALGTTAKAVESRLYRAREKLRGALRRWV
ncbi:MAG: sigma-70 family RNA polymerase sigma factor [Opitutus sp.]|nr:sigma-70 family RNA polymerase sigma factor [Opitutus sp.]